MLYGAGVDGCADPSCKPQPCVWPPPKPKHYTEAGVKCAAFPQVTARKVFTLPSQPTFAIDHNEPITIDWPPTPEPVTEYVETGPRPDLLAMIPDQIAPQVVTLMASPQYVNPGGIVTAETLPHPMCPDGSVHVSLQPTKPKPIEIRMPPREPAIKGPPCRPWTQCVENTLITDQVRRPLARCCHKRQLPPIVISCTKLEELKAKATERERQRAEKEAWCREQECLRLQSRQRQGKWNYTVESLLDRKHRQEREKEEAEKESTRQLLLEVAQEKKAASEAQIARAKQLMLYRKGLIRDFHSALAYSKMMQEIEETKTKNGGSGACGDECCPMFVQRCYKKMMYPNFSRPDYQSREKEKKPCSQELIDALKCNEKRDREQREEINNELCAMKQCIAQNLEPLPEKYIKYMAEPKCKDGQVQRKQQEMRCDLFYEIQDKLKLDAFIESHEKEIDRQACEFNSYRRQMDAIRLAKEKQLIDDKVAYNIRKSDAASKALVAAKAKQKGRAAEYDQLKDFWESEWEDKKRKKDNLLERRKERIADDFERRKRDEGWSRRVCGLHIAREWGKERLMAEENFERECDQKTDRRRQAEDNALYNKAQASHRHCVEQRQKYMDDVWAAKAKQEYVEEMKEMKNYAQKCIDDWKEKGRSTLPMHQAMKKWDYDAGMQPSLFASGDAPIYLQVQKQMALKNKKPSQCAEFETTSSRLGFGSGGCTT